LAVVLHLGHFGLVVERVSAWGEEGDRWVNEAFLDQAVRNHVLDLGPDAHNIQKIGVAAVVACALKGLEHLGVLPVQSLDLVARDDLSDGLCARHDGVERRNGKSEKKLRGKIFPCSVKNLLNSSTSL